MFTQYQRKETTTMSLDLNKIPEHILSDLRSRGLSESEIEVLSPEQAFSEYCEWNGLRGWAPSIILTIDSLREALVCDDE
jgi:hypothetical protein